MTRPFGSRRKSKPNVQRHEQTKIISKFSEPPESSYNLDETTDVNSSQYHTKYARLRSRVFVCIDEPRLWRGLKYHSCTEASRCWVTLPPAWYERRNGIYTGRVVTRMRVLKSLSSWIRLPVSCRKFCHARFFERGLHYPDSNTGSQLPNPTKAFINILQCIVNKQYPGICDSLSCPICFMSVHHGISPTGCMLNKPLGDRAMETPESRHLLHFSHKHKYIHKSRKIFDHQGSSLLAKMYHKQNGKYKLDLDSHVLVCTDELKIGRERTNPFECDHIMSSTLTNGQNDDTVQIETASKQNGTESIQNEMESIQDEMESMQNEVELMQDEMELTQDGLSEPNSNTNDTRSKKSKKHQKNKKRKIRDKKGIDSMLVTERPKDISPINDRSIIADYEPAITDVNSADDSISSIDISTLPFETNDNSIEASNSPDETYGRPLGANSSHVETNDSPIEIYSSPIRTNSSPIEVMSCPIEIKSCPVETNISPIETNSCPIDTNNSQVDSNSGLININSEIRPESPFHDYDLRVHGNHHVRILKSQKLRMTPMVICKRLSIIDCREYQFSDPYERPDLCMSHGLIANKSEPLDWTLDLSKSRHSPPPMFENDDRPIQVQIKSEYMG